MPNSFNKMRHVDNVIVIDDSADNTGGTAQIAYVTARVLSDRHYGVIYFAGCGPIHDRLHDIETIVVRDSPFLEDTSRIRGAMEGLHSKKTYAKLCETLSMYSPMNTVVHVHSWTHSLSSSIFDAIADCGFKSLVTLHDYFLICPNGGLYNYNKKAICGIRPCSVSCVLSNCDKRSYAQKLYRLERIFWQNRSIARAHPKFCYLSNFTYNVMRANRFVDEHPAILPNPISTISSNRFSDLSKRSGYLFVGRMDKEKNPELFCEALTRLGLSGVLCGDGPERVRLEKAYPNLKFLGWCSRNELSAQFHTKKALLLTSSLFEASPLVCLEAMLDAGIPSVVPDTCGATAYIEDGINGLYFQNQSLSSLCSKVKLMENLKFYEQICMNIDSSLPKVRKERSYETYAARIQALYEGMYE